MTHTPTHKHPHTCVCELSLFLTHTNTRKTYKKDSFSVHFYTFLSKKGSRRPREETGRVYWTRILTFLLSWSSLTEGGKMKPNTITCIVPHDTTRVSVLSRYNIDNTNWTIRGPQWTVMSFIDWWWLNFTCKKSEKGFSYLKGFK